MSDWVEVSMQPARLTVSDADDVVDVNLDVSRAEFQACEARRASR
jgi:hypothetical protein